MSLPGSRIRCHGCKFEGVMQHRSVTLRYALPDGQTVDAGRTFGWCNKCDGIRDTESSLNSEVIRQEINAQESRQNAIAGFFRNAIDRAFGGKPSDDQSQLRELSKLLRLAELRRSPPRCLVCGEQGAI